jgi:hypothetical protein
MSKAKKLGLIGVGVGFFLALAMSEFAFYVNSHHLTSDLSSLLMFGPDLDCINRDGTGNVVSRGDGHTGIRILECSSLWICVSYNWEDLGRDYKIRNLLAVPDGILGFAALR